MEGMITDITLAREKQQLFEDWMKMEEKKLKIDLSVQVQDNSVDCAQTSRTLLTGEHSEDSLLPQGSC